MHQLHNFSANADVAPHLLLDVYCAYAQEGIKMTSAERPANPAFRGFAQSGKGHCNESL
jgi:hypothetical protein